MEAYLIKSSVLITGFYLVYWFLIRKETYFLLNRLFLISGLMLAGVLPFLPAIHFANASNELINLIDGVNVSTAIEAINPGKNSDLINPMMIIYLSGVAWFSLRFLSSLGRILFLYLRFPKSAVNGLTTVVIKGDHAPFTFFNVLFISEPDISSDRDDSIIQHEMAHIRLMHSYDSVLAELFAIVIWFNPFIWLTRYALKAEHEYAADEQVMKEGYNQLSYQQLLVDRTLGVSMVGLANNFNYSLLKRRILMMTKNKSGTKAKLKYFLALPLVVLLFACTLADAEKVISQDDKIYDEVEIMPEYPGGLQEVRVHLAKYIIYPKIAKDQQVEGRVFVQFTVYEDGSVQDPMIMRTDVNTKVEDEVVVVGYSSREEIESSPQKEGILALEEEAVRVIKTIPDFKPGMQDGKPVKVRYTFPIVFVLQ